MDACSVDVGQRAMKLHVATVVHQLYVSLLLGHCHSTFSNREGLLHIEPERLRRTYVSLRVWASMRCK